MTSTVLGQSVLPPALDLLARAAASPLPAARRAWVSWRSAYDLDATSWPEVRLLGALAPRIDELEPGAEIARRLLGIQKFLWTRGALCIGATRPAVTLLTAHGIPCLMLKGAARAAQNPQTLRQRMIRDVDVLIPYDRALDAHEILRREGWDLQGWQVEPYAAAPFASHHAWAFSRRQGELDLHHFSNVLNRLVGDDDALWERAASVDWGGVPVLVPAAPDALLTAIVHGLRFSADGTADWVVDAAPLLSLADSEWRVFTDEARRRGVAELAATGLAYLGDVAGVVPPPWVLPALAAASTPAQRGEVGVYRSTNWPRTAEEELAAARAAAERALARIGPGGQPGPAGILAGVQRHGVLPGQHNLTVAIPRGALDTPICRLRVMISSSHLLAQATSEILYFAPGLPLGRSSAQADASGRAAGELVLPSVLLALRRIEQLRLEIYVPAHAGRHSFAVETAWA